MINASKSDLKNEVFPSQIRERIDEPTNFPPSDTSPAPERVVGSRHVAQAKSCTQQRTARAEHRTDEPTTFLEPGIIGVLVSGGDCAGLNALVRAIVLHAVKSYNWRVIGIKRGFPGIWSRPMQTMDLTPEVCNNLWQTSGGIFLGSNKNASLSKAAGDGKALADLQEAFVAGYNALGLDALIVVGGDGSFAQLAEISDYGSPASQPERRPNIIAIPKTIDNDVPYTDLAIGHETALDVIVEAIDKLQTTAESHDRVIVVEVMGKDAGHIALKSGIAAGADAILIPEIPYDIEALAAHIKAILQNWKKYAIVVVAESVKTPQGEAKVRTIGADEQTRYYGVGEHIAFCLKSRLPAEVRSVTLGHVQRGGGPRAGDRLLAAKLGVAAVDFIRRGEFGRVLCTVNGEIIGVALGDVVGKTKIVEKESELVRAAVALGIYIGA
ncbi:MAG: ATP-dependent 6-phosphofructokinase [Holosporales bacterium]|nr:ATP-dependent 6-phosphofructokinase [Holosporales bacterium]